jgi:hypothetical protein
VTPSSSRFAPVKLAGMAISAPNDSADWTTARVNKASSVCAS